MQCDVRIRPSRQRPPHGFSDVCIRSDERPEKLPEGVGTRARDGRVTEELGSCAAHDGMRVLQEELDRTRANCTSEVQDRRRELGPVVANAACSAESPRQGIDVNDESALVLGHTFVNGPQTPHLSHRERLVGEVQVIPERGFSSGIAVCIGYNSASALRCTILTDSASEIP